MSPPNRRALPRAPAALPVALTGGWGIAHDVSLCGMRVTTSLPRWPGQLVRVRFRVPGEPRAIRATCRVVGLTETPDGVALSLRFLRLHASAQLALHRAVDARPLPLDAGASARSGVSCLIERIVEDCAQLAALTR